MIRFIFPVAFLCLSAAAHAGRPPQGNEIALVTRTRGLVTVRHTGEAGYAIASRGYLLLDGAVVQTGADGFAEVKFIDTRSALVVRPESRVTLRASLRGGHRAKIAALDEGAVLVDAREGRRPPIDFSTPTALLTLRAGNALVLVSKNTHETTVFNLGDSAQAADNECRSWLTLAPNTAAFASSKGSIYVDTLDAAGLTQALVVVDLMRALKRTPPITHDVALTSGPNGTVSPPGKVVVLSDIALDITAQPDKGFIFSGWKVVDGAARIADITSPATQAFVNANSVIEAQFSAKPCRLTIASSRGGTVDPAGQISVLKDSPVDVLALPDADYVFVGWKTSSAVKIVEESYPVTRISLSASNGAITAQFLPKKYRLTVTGDESGAVTPRKPLMVRHGDSTEISAAPKEGFRFVEWKVTQGAAKIAEPRNPRTSVVCDSIDAAVQASFSDNVVEVSVLGHELASVEPEGQFFVVRNSVLTLAAKPSEGNTVSKWEVERGRAVVNGYEEATVRCRRPFEVRPVVVTTMYELSLMGNEHGTVIPAAMAAIPHGSPFTIVALPHKGKHFIRWRLAGGWAAIQDFQRDTTQVTLTAGAAIIQADFAPTLCSLKVEATPGGYTEPGGVIKNYEGGQVWVQAVPNPKAAFVVWEIAAGEKNIAFSDTITVAEQTITSIKGDAVIRALFSTDAVEMTVLSDGLGSTTPDGKAYVVKGQWTAIQASPNRGQSFAQWTAVTGTDVQFKDRLSAETEVMVSDNSVVKALFSITGSAGDVFGTGTFTLHVDCNQSMGKVENALGESQEQYTLASSMPARFVATPGAGYYFGRWQVRDGGPLISAPYDSATTITLNSGDATVEAVFLTKPLGTLKVQFKDYVGRTKTIYSNYR